jgi:hypothetical protein
MQLKEAISRVEMEQKHSLHVSYNHLELNSRATKLMAFFKAVDQSILFLQRRMNPTTFSNMRPLIERSTEKEFNLQQLAEVMAVVPNFLNHQWEIRSGKYEL